MPYRLLCWDLQALLQNHLESPSKHCHVSRKRTVCKTISFFSLHKRGNGVAHSLKRCSPWQWDKLRAVLAFASSLFLWISMLGAWNSSWHHLQIWKTLYPSNILEVFDHLLLFSTVFPLNHYLPESWIRDYKLKMVEHLSLGHIRQWNWWLRIKFPSYQINYSLICLGIEICVRAPTVKD